MFSRQINKLANPSVIVLNILDLYQLRYIYYCRVRYVRYAIKGQLERQFLGCKSVKKQ